MEITLEPMNVEPSPLNPEPTEIKSLSKGYLPSFKEKVPQVEELPQTDEGFHSMTPGQKRFHVIFYTLAVLTGMLIVQVIWQIAWLTAK
jgi:hypothetical protein